MQSSQNKIVVLITGCSMGGIGNSLALEFLARGCIVWATARSLSKLANLADKENVRIAVLDVNNTEQISAVMMKIRETDGKIDMLVNNAGFGLYGLITDCPIATIRSNFQTNVFGLIDLVQQACPLMLQKGGKILNMGSISSDQAIPGIGIYAATKSALAMITATLRQELLPLGIQVCLVQPGLIQTSFIGGISLELPKGEDSLHWKWRDALATYFSNSFDTTTKNGTTPVAEFSRKFVDFALKPKLSPRFRYGAKTWETFFGQFVPDTVSDRFMQLLMFKF